MGEEKLHFVQETTRGERPQACFCFILNLLGYSESKLISNVPRERKKEKLHYFLSAFLFFSFVADGLYEKYAFALLPTCTMKKNKKGRLSDI